MKSGGATACLEWLTYVVASPMAFNPTKNRQTLREFAIGYARESSYTEAEQLNCLASFGLTILVTGIECYLCGEFAAGVELIEKARVFFESAVTRKEVPPRYARGWTECSRPYQFAVCNWLLDKQHDLVSLQEAVKWREISFEETGTNDKYEVQLTLPGYLDAEEYEVLFRRFEIAKLAPPKNLRNIRGEGVMSYVLARHRLGLEYSVEEVDKALRSFLKRNSAPNGSIVGSIRLSPAG
jgi:hypothetical protein